ncbi:MAG: hypothetical protein IKP73_00750 [Bacteroidales bacterium]|jgi:hypothetical protein|nr:hypothetical protein [Bacteroidales bacterium]
MKKIQYFLTVALLLTVFAAIMSCKPTPKVAGDFNDQLMREQKAVVLKYDELLETFDTYVAAKMDAALIALSSQIESSKDNVNSIITIDGGDALKDEVLNYLSVFENVTADDLEYLVRLYKVPENEFTPEIRIQWDTRYKDVDTRIKDASARLKEVQAAFAENFNLQIVK